jgi:DNA-binding IclR family transcriptional regulator
VEDTVKLSSWDRARRVVILRRPVKQDLALTRRIKKQMELLLTDEAIQAY